MKYLILFLLFISFCQIQCIAQEDHTLYYDTDSTITTPNGSPVPDCYVLKSSVADIFLTEAQYKTQESDLKNNYNGATRVDSSSWKYNCHGYAWHMTKGNVDENAGKVWIGIKSGYSENVYWEDGSFIEVPEAYATIVSYHVSGDHSAVRESSDWYVSKWGTGPLVRHHPEDTDVNYKPTLEKTYYRLRPSISGLDHIYPMQNVDYNIFGIPSDIQVQWSVTGNASILSGQGSSSVTISGCSGSSITLTATLSAPISVTIHKTITVGAHSPTNLTIEPRMSYVILSVSHPRATCYDWEVSDYVSGSIGTGNLSCSTNSSINVTLTGGAQVGYVNVRPRTENCTAVPWTYATVRYWKPEIDESNSTLTVYYGSPVHLCLEEPAPSDEGYVQYYWYYDNVLYYTTSEPYITTSWWPCGEHLLKVKAVAGSIESEYDLAWFTGNCSSSWSAAGFTGGSSSKSAAWSAAYPNPVSNELFIDRNADFLPEAKSSEITVLLYSSEPFNLVYKKSEPAGTRQIRIDTSKLKNGIYYLSISDGKEATYNQTVIVKH